MYIIWSREQHNYPSKSCKLYFGDMATLVYVFGITAHKLKMSLRMLLMSSVALLCKAKINSELPYR